MEGEEELLTKIKNSKKEGISDLDITKRLLQKGYKLDYINIMINKSKRNKRIIFIVLLSLVFITLILSIFLIYLNFPPKETIPESYTTNQRTSSNTEYIKTNITKVLPAHISSLLIQMKATTLRKNPLTFEKPKICFKIGQVDYLSVIDGSKIQTTESLCKGQDINLLLSEEAALRILNSQDITKAITQSAEQGEINIEKVASDLELGAKGYLSLQKSLSG